MYARLARFAFGSKDACTKQTLVSLYMSKEYKKSQDIVHPHMLYRGQAILAQAFAVIDDFALRVQKSFQPL